MTSAGGEHNTSTRPVYCASKPSETHVRLRVQVQARVLHVKTVRESRFSNIYSFRKKYHETFPNYALSASVVERS